MIFRAECHICGLETTDPKEWRGHGNEHDGFACSMTLPAPDISKSDYTIGGSNPYRLDDDEVLR